MNSLYLYIFIYPIYLSLNHYPYIISLSFAVSLSNDPATRKQLSSQGKQWKALNKAIDLLLLQPSTPVITSLWMHSVETKRKKIDRILDNICLQFLFLYIFNC